MRKRRVEEFSLTNGCGIGNKNDHSGMQRFFSMKNEKIGTIVGNKRVLLGADCDHKFPVFGAAETKIIDMMGYAARRVCYFD